MTMKKLLFFAVVVLVMTSCATERQTGLRHVVAFKFKADATEAQVNALIDAFSGLEESIPQIKAFEWGLNNSPEGYDKGMTHIFQLTFDNEADRDIYLPHPAHKAFGDAHGGIIDDLVVVDYLIQ